MQNSSNTGNKEKKEAFVNFVQYLIKYPRPVTAK